MAMKILVIDPSQIFLRAACNFIDALPRCECVAAASPDEALGLPAVSEVDLVLIAYSLRRAGTESSAHRFKALAPAARVLLLTENAADYRNSCLAAEADGCLAIDSLGSELPQLVASLAPEPRREYA
ncbi:MAG: hypothetical protein OEL20_03740 [Sulfuritalea sp.]|nr:hypothetical protein [Sulfuritalea sp.]